MSQFKEEALLNSRKILLNIPESDARSILRNQLRINFPQGEFKNNSFVLYKRVSNTRPANILFQISGELTTSDNVSSIIYHIHPTLPSIALTLVFLVALLSGIISCIFNGFQGGYYILVGLIINITYNSFVLWARNEVIKNFETLFQ